MLPSKSFNKSVLERDTRLQILLNSIQVHRQYGVQQEVANENLKMQGRLLFITLFSALITFIYSKKNNLGQSKFIVILALATGIIWYGINVHKLDIETRGFVPANMLYKTEKNLLNIQPDDNRIYYLDYIKLDSVINKDTLDHKVDKIERFFKPDLFDIVFNMMPLFVFTFLYRKLKKTSQ